MTDGHLLGGRIAYRQPATGFRSGIEPVLLAASIPARPGEHVLEAGTGAGAALLCLTARLPDVRGTGVEIDPAMAELATFNAGTNGFSQIHVVAGDIETTALRADFDHAMANPPYHPDTGSASPHPGRELAKRGSDALIRRWVERLAGSLRAHGTLTMILPAAAIPLCLDAMVSFRCPCTAVFPLWPKAGRSAKLVLVRAVRMSKSPMRLMPGLVLHRADGSYTDEARLVLHAAAVLPLDDTPG